MSARRPRGGLPSRSLQAPSRAALVVALAVLGTLLVVMGGPDAPRAHAATPTRILVHGDSITQQSSGDWTWRCRIWQHLRADGAAVDFVGPRQDLWNWRTDVFGSMAYAEPACDNAHASTWGNSLARPAYDVSDLVKQYSIDVVISQVGINDLLYGLLSFDQMIDRWRTDIAQSRAQSPSVDFVLVPVPDVWYAHVTEYNQRLEALAAELDTTQSRVVVPADPALVRTRDTLDNSHPSPNGEIRIAATISDALAEIGVGNPYARPLPTLPPGPILTVAPRVTASEGVLRASWTPPDFANAQRVWLRDVTRRTAWRALPGDFTGSSWWTRAAAGHTYSVRLQPVKGNFASATLSSVRSVRVPARARAVTAVRATRRAGCRAALTWRDATYATGYAVLLRDVTGRRSWHLARAGQVRVPRLVTGALRRHHLYDVMIRSYGPLLGGSTRPVRFLSCR